MDCLQRSSAGNPDHCLQLANYLVRSGTVRHVDGVWVLPSEIDEKSLPASRAQRVTASLDVLSPTARELARVLSIHRGLLTLPLCATLSELDSRARLLALQELVREEVLTGSENGYRFRNAQVQAALRDELAPALAQRAHASLGEHLLQSAELHALERLEAGHHLLRGSAAGLLGRGAAVVMEAATTLALHEHGRIGEAVDTLEACLATFRAEGASGHEQSALLSALALAGFYTDRKLALRRGEEALAVLGSMLGLGMTRRLRPFVGKKLALYLGLTWAALGFFFRREKPAVPSQREATRMLCGVASALTSASSVSYDTAATERYAAVLEPLRALGEDHAVSVVHEYCQCASAALHAGLAAAHARWQSLLERLDGPAPVRDLPEEMRAFYRSQALHGLGVLECWREPSRAPELAERLAEQGSELAQLESDQLRMLQHANQGDLASSERLRGRAAMQAIQGGAAWQTQAWLPMVMSTVYLRTYDAMRLKECLEQLRELARSIPFLAAHVQPMQGMYLLVRGRYEAAIRALENAQGAQPSLVCRARVQGALARAYNGLGDHARAKAICEAALAQLSTEDLAFVAIHLLLQQEHAVALARLGEVARARQLLQELLVKQEPHCGPLTLGALHETLAQVEAMAGDEAASARHYEAMEQWYRGTKIASLLERCERMAWERHAKETGSEGVASGHHGTVPSLATVIHRIRHGGDTDAGAQWALEQLADFGGLRTAAAFLMENGALRLVASVGAAPSSQVCTWLESRVATTATASSVTAQVDGLAVPADPNRAEIDGHLYRMLALRVGAGAGERSVGVLAVREEPGETVSLPFDLLRALGSRVLDANTEG